MTWTSFQREKSLWKKLKILQQRHTIHSSTDPFILFDPIEENRLSCATIYSISQWLSRDCMIQTRFIFILFLYFCSFVFNSRTRMSHSLRGILCTKQTFLGQSNVNHMLVLAKRVQNDECKKLRCTKNGKPYLFWRNELRSIWDSVCKK